jgi:hypothetical protein
MHRPEDRGVEEERRVGSTQQDRAKPATAAAIRKKGRMLLAKALAIAPLGRLISIVSIVAWFPNAFRCDPSLGSVLVEGGAG